MLQSAITEEAEGKGAREQGEQALPFCVERSGTWVQSPALPGRLDWGGVQAPSHSVFPPASFD